METKVEKKTVGCFWMKAGKVEWGFLEHRCMMGVHCEPRCVWRTKKWKRTGSERRDESKFLWRQEEFSLAGLGQEVLMSVFSQEPRRCFQLRHQFLFETSSSWSQLPLLVSPGTIFVFQNHCHYQGFVQDMEGSSVAMSICNGLRWHRHTLYIT